MTRPSACCSRRARAAASTARTYRRTAAASGSPAGSSAVASVPDFQTLTRPLLELHADGAEKTQPELDEALARQFELTEEELAQRLPGGSWRTFPDRVAWASTHMTRAGLLVKPRRGISSITERGAAVLAEHLDRVRATHRATDLKLHDGVRLRREVDGFPAGTEGAIVQVFRDQEAYGVELFEAPGRTIGLVDASADDLGPAAEQLR